MSAETATMLGSTAATAAGTSIAVVASDPSSEPTWIGGLATTVPASRVTTDPPSSERLAPSAAPPPAATSATAPITAAVSRGRRRCGAGAGALGGSGGTPGSGGGSCGAYGTPQLYLHGRARPPRRRRFSANTQPSAQPSMTTVRQRAARSRSSVTTTTADPAAAT